MTPEERAKHQGRLDRAERRAHRLEQQAASVVCCAISNCGLQSPQVAEAHAIWRKAWLAWADAFDAALAGRHGKEAS